MKILIDTNIVLDFLLTREGLHESSSKIIKLAYEEDTFEYVTASSITDIYYLVNKNVKNSKETKEKIKLLLELISVLEVSSSDIKEALNLDWKDFEDSVQYVVALHHGVDLIITRNKTDFQDSTLPVYTPDEFLEIVDSI